MKSFYLLTLAAAVALAACSNDDSTPDPNPSPADTGLVIEQTEYTLDALDNRSATLTFSASADWTLTVTGEDADCRRWAISTMRERSRDRIWNIWPM